MPLYYVNIPCYISVDAPELARRPNKFCAIGVHASSPSDALSKVTEALQRAVDDADARDLSVCGWQECEAAAVAVRDTPWGDMDVCAAHEHTPLEDYDGAEPSAYQDIER